MPRAVITGASAGIGEALARKLAKEGWDLVLAARREEKLKELASRLEKEHAIKAEVLRVDVTSPDAPRLLVEKAGDADLLVNNAGYGRYGAAVETPPEVLTGMVRLNCEAATGVMLAFLPLMVARGRGTILNLASIAGFQPIPYFAVYSATKAYMLTLSIALDAEVRKKGVRVLALCPGPVPTEFQEVAGTPPGHAATFLAVTAEQVADEALWMIKKGKRVWVPNFFLRTAMRLEAIVPQRIVVYFAEKSVRSKQSSNSASPGSAPPSPSQ